jgi:DNA segregation ATPase FtsK/SpoIIIE, S-DNA-T family
MAKKKKQNIKAEAPRRRRSGLRIHFPKINLPEETKNWIWGILIFIVAVVLLLSFFDKAGSAGRLIYRITRFLIGRAFFLTPFIFVFAGTVFFTTKYKKFFGPTILAIVISVLGLTGILEGLDPGIKNGGWVGFIISYPFLNYFSIWVNQLVFGALILFGVLIFWYLLKPDKAARRSREEDDEEEDKEPSFAQGPEERRKGKGLSDKEPSLIKKILFPQFKLKEIEPTKEMPAVEQKPAAQFEFKTKEAASRTPASEYQMPPLDLLDSNKENPTAGDTKINQLIIKKTLQNFDIPVEMAEVNIGPTVTQYSFKPAEGVKLSKITGLSNDLSLSLAAHPIRIEAPIPGRSLVGVEIPNRIRAKVGLKDMIANPVFQTSPANLNIALGRDVSGAPAYADLAKMPHLLVAGSTGSGKTIFLNTLILSLIYRNSPEMMSLILVDPKRVEFPVYNDLPHLLAPVILDANRAVNALKWLISEMERRFEVLSKVKARDIISYNQQIEDRADLLPYIVVVVDELADLMAARGRDMEAGIVRLAQMARAVGIHLVLATQRPSVEVITGLIKANITSRVTFQVASQVDSRTIIDTAGAEKLLGRGDMLFLSSELGKPRRIQGAYLSDKEVKRVANFVKSKNERSEEFALGDEVLNVQSDLERSLEAAPQGEFSGDFSDDPLYEEAKRVVIESKKASASLLQRRLRVGYARAARLIDILEEKGIVGPGEGAKPREVYGDVPQGQSFAPAAPEAQESAAEPAQEETVDDNDGFKPIDISSDSNEETSEEQK